MRDSHRPAPCPVCSSRNVSVLHATHNACYVACHECDHIWHLALDTVDPLYRRTSAAFRMTARVVANRGANAIAT